jgi:hypothetical protein
MSSKKAVLEGGKKAAGLSLPRNQCKVRPIAMSTALYPKLPYVQRWKPAAVADWRVCIQTTRG